MNISSQSVNEVYESYLKARNSIGIVNLSHLGKFLISGPSSLDLINHYSPQKNSDKNGNGFFTVFMKRKKFIGEVLVLKLSQYRYLVIGEEKDKIYKFLKKARRKFRTSVISDCTNEYAFFAFHGSQAKEFFQDLDYRYIYRAKRQNYAYFQLLSPKKDEGLIMKHFLSLNFKPLSLEAEKLFLYNNNVILNIDRIPRSYRLSVINELYPFSELKYKIKPVKIRKYELEKNFLVTNKHKIYNHSGKKIGIIHCSYRLPYKRNPFIIAFIKSPAKSVSMVKVGKHESLIKPIFNY